jgi:serine/threonine-protein kinase
MSNAPSVIGRFQVLRRIARGGMGTLYLAWDPKLDRQIAIKVLTDDNDDLRERFSREARSAAQLHHPHIVTIFDVGEHDGQPFIAMEYIEGETLAAIIKNRLSLTTSRKLEIIEQLAEGLEYAHRIGVVHRDIKPANIMIALDGSVKILDFGIARIGVASSMTATGVLMGTLSYMAPEQAAGKKTADKRSDVFAVGATLYELLCFQQAFQGGFADGILHRVMHEKPEPLENLCPGIDPEIIQVVAIALEKDPANRYQELGAMRRDLQRIRNRLPGDPPPALSTDETKALPAAQLRTPSPDPSRRSLDRDELERRRAKQIEGHVAQAREAIAAGNYDAAIGASEQVLMIDPYNGIALEVLDRARAVLDERQADEWLTEAELEIERGALTSALAKIDRAAALNHSSVRAQELRQTVGEAMAARERARQHAEAIRRQVDHAHELFDQGLFQEAIAAADAALVLEPSQPEALDLKSRSIEAIQAREREALERRARDAVREARRLFAADQHGPALEHLARFEPPHELVTNALDQLRAEAARIAEQRQIEAKKRARREHTAAELASARTEIEAHDFAAALQRLRALRGEDNSSAVDALIREAEESQKAEELAAKTAAEVAEHVARAAGLLARQDLDGALSRIDAALHLAPDHRGAQALRSRIEGRIRAVAEFRAAEEARARERDRAIAQALAAARQASSHESVIVALRDVLDLDPDHDEAKKLLAAHQDALAREESERARQRRADAARREQILTLMNVARQALDREDFSAARQAIHSVMELEPANRDARSLSDEIAAAEAARARTTTHSEDTTEKLAPSARGEQPVAAAASDTTIPAASTSRDVSASQRASPPPPRRWTSRQIYWLSGSLTAIAVLVLGVRLLGPVRPAPARVSTAAETPPPADVSPAPAVPVAAAPPPGPSTQKDEVKSPTASEATAGTAPRVDDLPGIARAQLAGGHRQQGLETIAAGLKTRPNDAELRTLLTQTLADARSRLRAARDGANRDRAAASRLPNYKEAARNEQEVIRLTRSGRVEEAIRAAWLAADLFTNAAAEARASTQNSTPAAESHSAQPAPIQPRPSTERVEQGPPSAPAVQPAPIRQAPAPTPPESTQPERPTQSPPPATAPPSAAAPTPAVRPPAPGPSGVSDDSAIRRVLEEYADAYNHLDAAAVRRVFPAVNEPALRQNFAGMKSYQTQIQNETISINGTTATVSCTWALTFTGQVGGVQRAAPKVVIRLQKTGDRWIIVERR